MNFTNFFQDIYQNGVSLAVKVLVKQFDIFKLGNTFYICWLSIAAFLIAGLLITLACCSYFQENAPECDGVFGHPTLIGKQDSAMKILSDL